MVGMSKSLAKGGEMLPQTCNVLWHKYRQASAAKGMMGASAPGGWERCRRSCDRGFGGVPRIFHLRTSHQPASW